jgi:hypothetical protein
MDSTQHPTWDDTIRQLFAAPYWIEQQRREGVGTGWRECMDGYQVYLDQYASVCQYAVTIYDHLASRAMPLTTDQTQFWPDDALAQLRTWVNEGCRQTAGDPIKDDHRIPPPDPRPPKLRVRKNILDLTQAELDEYRMKIEEAGASSADPNSLWVRTAYLHTDWCLHYQEAFLLWHRANLLYLEQRIDFPIPYWNWMSPNATVDGDPAAGLPQAFKDLTYIHPKSGQERPNPLRFAVAKDGRSKACAAGQSTEGIECRYVQRDPILYTEGDQQREERQSKLNLLSKYQQQVAFAFQWPVFSTPEGYGQPWANILSFDPPPPDSDYPHQSDFDGLYEQPHDNLHGWVGPDMADNAYTAFDPVFWAHHSNIDRIFEEWKRAHPAATYTSNFPLRPFAGPQAAEIDLANPETFVYTTIGDMARDSRALGYDFAPPAVPDSIGAAYNEWSDQLYVMFNNVRCIQDTYTIDVFLNLDNPQPQDIHGNQLHYVGRVTRLGMGVEDDKGRCTVQGVTRVLDASYNAFYLKLTPNSTIALSQIVTDVTTGKQLTPDEYRQLPGFEPSYLWGKGDPNARPARQANQPSGQACH